MTIGAKFRKENSICSVEASETYCLYNRFISIEHIALNGDE